MALAPAVADDEMSLAYLSLRQTSCTYITEFFNDKFQCSITTSVILLKMKSIEALECKLLLRV